MYERLKEDPDALEKEADLFASEFLMPATECRNELFSVTYGKLPQLKIYWQVSKKAIIYRAKTLGCISATKFKNLMIELSRNGERIKESFDVEIDKPKLLDQIIKAHLNSLNYTMPELANMLCISESDLLNLNRLNGDTRLRIAV